MGECNQKKIFCFFTSDTICVFKSHHCVQVAKTLKKACVKESQHPYLFSQCFGNSHSYIPIKSSNFCNGVSAELKNLNSNDYIFNPLHFVTSFEGSHFGFRANVPFHTKKVNPLKIQGQTTQYIQVPLFCISLW